MPQGSVLGPILYLLYTADTPKPSNKDIMIATFADYTVLLSSHKNVKTAVENLQQTVGALIQWLKICHLNVNNDKSLQVIFTTKTKYVLIPIIINGKDGSIVNSAKYLGMHLDSKLNWKQHIAAEC